MPAALTTFSYELLPAPNEVGGLLFKLFVLRLIKEVLSVELTDLL